MKLKLFILASALIIGTEILFAQVPGTVVAWGDNSQGQTNVPAGLTNVIAIAAGGNHSLALKSDGTVVAWGDPAETNVPPDLTNVIAIAAFQGNLALKSDGTVVGWGSNGNGQTTVPGGLNNAAGVAVGAYNSLVLKKDGTVIALGVGCCGGSSVPGNLTDAKMIAAGWEEGLAVRSNGTVVAWGINGVPANLTNVIAVASGNGQNLALKSDGTVVAWGNLPFGWTDYGQTTVPSNLTDVISISASGSRNVVLKKDGTIISWGDNPDNVNTTPSGLKNVISIAAGYSHTIALVRSPQPITILQTNRVPANSELGKQTIGILKMFTNGVFTNFVALDPNKKTVVLTHGWIPTLAGNDLFSNGGADGWPWEMAELLQFQLGSSALNIVAWDWPTNARSPWYDPWAAADNTPQEGRALGASLLAALGANYSKPIHFIGHSFGTVVNADAADYLQANDYSWTNMQMTLFDEAEVGSGTASNDFQSAAISVTTILANDSSSQPFWYHPLPNNFAWADNYITAFGLPHTNAANIILTNLYPAPTDLYVLLTAELPNFHAYPMTWYDDSITTPFGSSMGFRWSFEENNLTPPPATNTFFLQAFNGSDLNLVPTDFSTASQLLNSRLQKMLTAHEYTLLQALPNPVQATGQIDGEFEDILTQDPYALTTGLPEGWGININLTTSSSSGSSSPAPQAKAHPLGLGANDDSSNSTNFPAYAWIPLAVPSNAVSMSFDFIFQGDGASDSFAVALNGTNVFSVPTSLIQTNITMNSGQIDVSQYAGTNVELFLGIVGGTSTNASISASGFRFYSILPPSLQAQASGNNFVLQWPLSAANYTLETSTDLISWTTNADVPVIVNLQNAITNSISGGARFYRLKK
jgi:pimeloyl-ACP methyl ester carboxylesterase